MSETTENLRRIIEVADTRGSCQIDGADARWLELAIEMIEQTLGEEIERLRAALNYVADNTYCGKDAEWHFKPGYDPQVVLDAIPDR